MEAAGHGSRTAREGFGERELAEHGRRFLEISSDLLAIVDEQGAIVWANDSWARVLGVAIDEVRGHGYRRFLHPDDLKRVDRGIAEGPRVGEGTGAFEVRYKAPEGGYVDVLWSTTRDHERGLVYAAGRDVTEERRSRDELAASQRRLAEAQRISHLGGWTYDPASGEVVWSDELYRVFRVDPSRYRPSYDAHLSLVHPEDVDKLESAVARLVETGEPYSFDYRIVAGDGETRTLFTRARLEARDDGTKYVTGVCQDVTEARAAEAELARSVSVLEATLEATAEGIIVTGLDGTTISWNQNFADLWGIPNRLLETHDRDAITPIVLGQVNDPEAFVARVAELYANPELEGFDVLEFKDGRVCERYTAPQRLEGEVVGRVWSFRDITESLRAEREKIELEARLEQSERLESLGRLAGGIAHDFNNHLVAILNYATLVNEELPDGAHARDDLDEVIRAAQRASELTRELVAFSRQEIVEPRPLILNELVSDAERLLRRTIGEDVELRVSLGDDIPSVEADPGQLERVLMNLAVNARDAMPDGGVLEITTERIDGDDTIVRLTVRDEGTGMSEEVAKRAMDPFFTTKPRGEGTGLGLATVYGIVNQSGGHVAIESAPGEGTTMTIDLPASGKPPRAAADLPEEPPPRARGSVLVVEDEAAVRRLTARLLRDAGFAAIEAADGHEALRLLESAEADDLCLLLTDIVMPQMSGRELAERVQEAKPDLPVLFMSGYTDDVVFRHGVAEADLPYVAKPFTRETLLAAVAEAIESGPPALS